MKYAAWRRKPKEKRCGMYCYVCYRYINLPSQKEAIVPFIYKTNLLPGKTIGIKNTGGPFFLSKRKDAQTSTEFRKKNAPPPIWKWISAPFCTLGCPHIAFFEKDLFTTTEKTDQTYRFEKKIWSKRNIFWILVSGQFHRNFFESLNS